MVQMMIPREQTRTGANGNCFAAALASVLETEIPDFGMNVSDAEFYRNMTRWLAKKGYHYTEVPASGKPPKGYHLMLGISPRGGRHAVVGKAGRIVHDPHPQDNTGRGLASVDSFGILKPMESSMAHDSEVPQEYRELMLPVEYRTGLCPTCGEEATVNLDGTVAMHGNCAGWGMPPLLGDFDNPGAQDSGEAFKKLEHKLAHKKGIYDPAGLAAAIGRKAMGKQAFQAKAAAGRRAK